jgi:excisionase family DNA binding protein
MPGTGVISAAAEGRSGWLTVRQVARELVVVPRTVHGLINTGQLTGYWIGRVIRVRRVDLDRYLESVPHHARCPQPPVRRLAPR